MGDRSKHFSWYEIACDCGCGYAMGIKKLIDKLEVAREIADIPFHINSWCRCVEHNQAVGGVAGSSHIQGLAVDIRCNTKTRRVIYDALRQAGFTRLGIARSFIHADVDDSKPDAVWRYQ